MSSSDKVRFGLLNDALATGSKKVQPLIDLALNDGLSFNFAVAPIMEDHDANAGFGPDLEMKFVHEFEVAPKNWKSNFQALLLCNAEDGPRSDFLLERQIGYALHIGVKYLWIDISNCNSYQIVKICRVINSYLTKSSNIFQYLPEFRFKLPLKENETTQAEIKLIVNGGSESNDMDLDEALPSLSSWEKCALVRDIIRLDSRVGLALELEENLPDDAELEIWDGERIFSLVIPVETFLTNQKGYPVLPVSHQDFVKRVIHRQAFKLDIVIKPSATTGKPLHLYFQYVDWLRGQASRDNIKIIRGYEDYLQVPLQPLKDHLESEIYAVFEDDAAKYIAYQNAIKEALLDKKEQKKASQDTDDCMVVMVLGAGRGPLVNASIFAAREADVPFRVIVVEKNPHAVATLRHLKENNPDWIPADITINHCDMRSLATDVKADICVSELLGSLADNELSPECLSHVWSYLKSDGVCIPQSYTSYIQPIMSQRLHTNTLFAGSVTTSHSTHYNPMDIAYVSLVRNFYPIDEPKQLIVFEHMGQDTMGSASDAEKSYRYVSLSFNASRDCSIHGFAGYFDAVLYKDVTISTHPDRHTEKMYSWFPFWIPLRENVRVKTGDKVTVHFWRIASPRDVWYEWCLSDPRPTRIQNCNGESNRIGLI